MTLYIVKSNFGKYVYRTKSEALKKASSELTKYGGVLISKYDRETEINLKEW